MTDGSFLQTTLFAAYAALVVGGALGVAFCRNVVRMAVCLTTCLGAVAGLFLLLGADFVAAAQLLVYVGGTIILLIFGVMLTAASAKPELVQESEATSAFDILLAGLFGLSLLALLVVCILQAEWGDRSPYLADGRTSGQIGTAMLGLPGPQTTSYLLPFEIVSVHLLVVLVGAAYLARAVRTVGPAVGEAVVLQTDLERIDDAAESEGLS